MKRFKKFGTALLSCMMLTASFATVSNMTMITAEAHPGRTDAPVSYTHLDVYKRQVLKISNMDFVVGLMEELPVNADQKDIILGLIRTKNRSGLEKLCADLALPEGDTEKLMKVSGLYGEFGRVLAEAGAIADTPKMKEAVALRCV